VQGNLVQQEWVAKVAKQIASALEYIHANGVVHGSLKSKDVLINWEGNAKLVDYGLLPAKLSVSSGFSPVSSCYVAPEVWVGKPPTEKSDVYR